MADFIAFESAETEDESRWLIHALHHNLSPDDSKIPLGNPEVAACAVMHRIRDRLWISVTNLFHESPES